MNLILYGPPGSGKSTVGALLAESLGRPFVDTDALIEQRAGMTIPQLFATWGEARFRALESEVCAELATQTNRVIALGGGAMLLDANRQALSRAGLVVCLRAEGRVLLERTSAQPDRPLLAGGNPAQQLNDLLSGRRALYQSFPVQIDTTHLSPPQVAEIIMARLQRRTLLINAPNMSQMILLGYGVLEALPDALADHGIKDNRLIITDNHVAPRLPDTVQHLPRVILPAGEQHKTPDTVQRLYEAFLANDLDRQSTVIAVGGGVIGDIAGFAAATFMRGIRWVSAPTTLLAMVDASLGGKTGVDLPQGKNLVGAFHPPTLVVSDPLALNTLPPAESSAGMAEVIKHGVIGDAALFETLETLTAFGDVSDIERAIRVKIKIVEDDPMERGQRAKLNAGHTIGHGIESASGYAVRHGQAVAIGLYAEAMLSERMGIAPAGLADRIAGVLKRFGLPTCCPSVDPGLVRRAMRYDKKKSDGKLTFALPKAVGDVLFGIEAPETALQEVLARVTSDL